MLDCVTVQPSNTPEHAPDRRAAVQFYLPASSSGTGRVTVSLSPEKAFHLLQRASMLSSEMKSSEPMVRMETCRGAP